MLAEWVGADLLPQPWLVSCPDLISHLCLLTPYLGFPHPPTTGGQQLGAWVPGRLNVRSQCSGCESRPCPRPVARCLDVPRGCQASTTPTATYGQVPWDGWLPTRWAFLSGISLQCQCPVLYQHPQSSHVSMSGVGWPSIWRACSSPREFWALVVPPATSLATGTCQSEYSGATCL